MAARIIELKGSGDFKAGPSGVDGKGLAIVLDAEDQDEAFALADAFFPPLIAGIPRGSIDTKELGGGVYSIDVEYRSAIAGENAPTAGQPPAEARPPAEGGSNDAPLSRDMTFSTGGATKRILKSIKTRHFLAKAGDTAPSYGKLINVNSRDNKVEGCEVIAPMCDFTITKRFYLLTLGWFRNMMDLIACTNEAAWLGMEAGEVLFKGCDGNFKDGDKAPWTVTGKFGYSRNYVYGESEKIDDMLTLGSAVEPIIIPDIKGWEYLWVMYGPVVNRTIVRNGQTITVKVEWPRFAYVEQVYHEGNLSTLGLDV